MLTWLHMPAVLVHISAAGLRQQDVVAEVGHLHLLKVEHLDRAGLAPNGVLLLRQAAEHTAPAGLPKEGRALRRAQGVDVRLARIAQPVVEPAQDALSSQRVLLLQKASSTLLCHDRTLLQLMPPITDMTSLSYAQCLDVVVWVPMD